MKNFITILLVSVVILFTLGGCGNPVSDVLNDMDRTTITYNNEKYVATTDWLIDDSSYKEKVMTEQKFIFGFMIMIKMWIL